jgi:hypothetical protein
MSNQPFPAYRVDPCEVGSTAITVMVMGEEHTIKLNRVIALDELAEIGESAILQLHGVPFSDEAYPFRTPDRATAEFRDAVTAAGRAAGLSQEEIAELLDMVAVEQRDCFRDLYTGTWMTCLSEAESDTRQTLIEWAATHRAERIPTASVA